MKVASSLFMLLALMFLTLLLWPRDTERVTIALAAGFLIIGAWLTGRIFAAISLPRISGYLVFGLLVGPSAWALIADAWTMPRLLEQTMPLISLGSVKDMQFVKDLATSLIAITAGSEIRLDWLRGQFKRVIVLSLAAVLGVGVIIFPVLWGAHLTFGMLGPAEYPLIQTLIALGLLSLVATGNSPTVAIAVMTEMQAEGPLSRTTLAVTVVKDLLIIVLFATAVAVGRGVLIEQGALSGTFLLAVGAQLGGSLGLGAIAGLAMAWFVSHVKQHLAFFVVGACFLFALIGEQPLTIAGHHWHLEPLLLALSAGLIMQNVRPEQSAPLFDTIEEMSLPVYALFFAVAGAQLDLSTFAVGAVVAAMATLVVTRALAIWGVITLTARLLKIEPHWRRKLWLCLTPQSAVTLALTGIFVEGFRQFAWARVLQDMLLAAVAVHILLGPIGYRWALVKAGEAGKGTSGAH